MYHLRCQTSPASHYFESPLQSRLPGYCWTVRYLHPITNIISDGRLRRDKRLLHPLPCPISLLSYGNDSSPTPQTPPLGYIHSFFDEGGKTDKNAHPHVDFGNRIALVHNGTINNATELRRELNAKGIDFRSETDSEVHSIGFPRGCDDCLYASAALSCRRCCKADASAVRGGQDGIERVIVFKHFRLWVRSRH